MLIKKEEAFHQLSEKRSRDIIFLSSNQSLLDLARDVDVPAIAYQKPEMDTFLHADMVVEGFEEVDMTFLQRVYAVSYTHLCDGTVPLSERSWNAASMWDRCNVSVDGSYGKR